jgi:soluble lytic murein transglycosylase
MKPLRLLPWIFLLAGLCACNFAAPPTPHAVTFGAAATLPQPEPTRTPAALTTPTAAADESLVLGDRALRNGDYAAAIDSYNRALAAGTEPERAAFFLARALYEAGKLPDARTALDELLAASAGDYAARADFLLGEVAAAQADWPAAVAAYQQMLALAPGALTDVVQERVGDSFVGAGDYDRAVQAYAAAADAADPYNRLWLLEKEADALSGAKKAEAAIAIYEQELAAVTSDYARARLQRKIGGSLIALGRTEEGYARYEAALQYPLSHDAFLCLSELVYAGYAVDGLVRGVVDYYEGVYDTTVAVLTDYLAGNPADPAQAYYFRGLALRALDDPTEAAADFEAAAALGPETGYWDSALFDLAYTRWAWLDDYAGASAILAGLADAQPAHPRAAEALFTAARIAERGGDLVRAAQLWDRVAQDYPSDSGAAEARHQAGIALYRAGDFQGAQQSWEPGAASGDGWVRSQALFWMGKVRAKLGDAAGAQAAFERAAAASPTDYYSERAEDVLNGWDPFAHGNEINPVFDLDAEYAEAAAWAQTVFPAEQSMEERYAGVENDLRLQRGRILWDCGAIAEAEAEFDSLWAASAGDPAGELYLSRYFESLGYYPGAIQAARKVLDAAGFNDAQTLAAPRYFSHVRFGPYFMDLLVPQAARFSLHPLLVFALVRQESLFGVSAASAANAHGLMQLIPSTAEAVAKQIGLEGLTLRDLYRPVINVQLGTAYLAEQRDSFGGDLFMALAAYNGGPGSAAIWRDLSGGGDDDLFVEVIRYDETRNYVRRIYENYMIYDDLYQV